MSDAQEMQPPCKRVVGRPFVAGHDPRRNNGGRKKDVPSLKAACLRVYSKSDVEKVARKLLEMALKGDVKSVRLLGEMLGDTAEFTGTINNVVITGGHMPDAVFMLPHNNREPIPVDITSNTTASDSPLPATPET